MALQTLTTIDNLCFHSQSHVSIIPHACDTLLHWHQLKWPNDRGETRIKFRVFVERCVWGGVFFFFFFKEVEVKEEVCLHHWALFGI
jgi:hypothetical protein